MKIKQRTAWGYKVHMNYAELRVLRAAAISHRIRFGDALNEADQWIDEIIDLTDAVGITLPSRPLDHQRTNESD